MKKTDTINSSIMAEIDLHN